MLIGYARVSKADGSQSLDLQRDALIEAGVEKGQIYSDLASGNKDDRSGLEACLKALREGDVLVVWRLDRMGRNLHHLVRTVSMLSERGVGLKVLTGQGTLIDTTTAAGRLSFGIFAALAEFERELIRERTVAGLKAARARGRVNRHSTVTHYQRPNMTHPQEGGTGGEVSEILFFSAKSKRRPSLIYSMQIIPVCLSIVARRKGVSATRRGGLNWTPISLLVGHPCKLFHSLFVDSR